MASYQDFIRSRARQQTSAPMGGPSTALAAPYTATRWGDTIGSVNSGARPYVAPPIMPPATMAPSIAGLNSRGANPGPSIMDNPRFGYYVSQGATPLQAMQLVDREQAGQAQQARDQTQMTALQEPTGGLDPFGSLVVSGGQKVAPYVQYGVEKAGQAQQWGLDQVQGAQAEMLYTTAKKYRQEGMSDREIISIMKTPANPLMWNVPIGPNDSDEDIKAFFDGLILAYEGGYTAYSGRPQVNPAGVQISDRTPVAQWGPGAKAAHEFLAGEGSWVERAIGDTALDPTNYALGPLRGTGESIASAGTRLVAKGTAEEGTMAAAKVAAGRIAQGTGKVLAVPDVVLNQAADNVVGATLGTAVDVAKQVPGVGRAVDYVSQTPIRIKARATGEDAVDALNIADEIEQGTGAQFAVGGTSPTTVTPPVASAVPTGPAGPIVPPTGMADVPNVLGGSGARQGRPALTEAERIAAVANGNANLFSPDEHARRLVDNAAAGARTGNPDLVQKAETFQAVNGPKQEVAWSRDRELEAQIKQMQDGATALKAERDALPGFTPERDAVQQQIDELYAGTEPLKVDQKINGVEHTVFDVAEDYKNIFGELPDVPVTATRVDMTRARVNDERLIGGELTPNGNRVKASKDPLGGSKYTVTGSVDGKAKSLYVTMGNDGGWTVKSNRVILGKALSDSEVVDLVDKTLGIGKASYAQESTSYLIERAVYENDANAMRVVRERVTPEQYERVKSAHEALRDIRTSVPRAVDVSVPSASAIPEPTGVSADNVTVTPIETPPVTPVAAPEPVPGGPSTALPTDVHNMVNAEKFAGKAEPLYTGKSLRQVRDSIIPKVEADKARANQLIAEIKADKTTLGLDAEKPLTVKGQSKAKAAKRPVIEAPVSGPVKGKQKPLPPVSSKDVLAKEQELADLLAEYSPHDLIADEPRAIANSRAAYARELDISPELAKRRNLALDLVDALIFRLPRHLLLADPATSWAYTQRNIIGNIQTSALGTQGESLTRVMDSFRSAFGDQPTLAERITEDLGLGKTPAQFNKETLSAVDAATMNGFIPTNIKEGAHTPTRELARKLKIDAPARLFDKKRAIDAGFEYGAKVSTYGMVLQGLATDNMAKLADELTAYAAKRGVSFEDREILDMMFSIRKKETGLFSYKDLYDGMYQQAVAKGMTGEAAQRMAKTAGDKWKFATREFQLDAIGQTNRIFPSQRRMTNLDTYLKYISIFHFWPTRTYRLVLEEMIRNPQLYTAWQRANAGLERMAEEGNYPDSVKMLMRIADSPFGFVLYANPVSLFLVTALAPETQSINEPEGMTKFGKWIKEIRDKTGLGVSPFVDSVLNVMGVYGNAFPPNPWPSRTTELAGAALDYGLVSMGHAPGTPVYDNTMAKLRGKLSGIVPGTSNVPFTDQGAFTMDIIGSVVLDNNPELKARMAQVGPDGRATADAIAAQDEFAAIMGDEDNPERIEAQKQAAGQNLMTRTINVISPFTVKAKMNSREFTVQDAKAGRAIRDDGGLMSPIQQGAVNVRSAVTQTPEYNALDAQVNEWQAIGTERQQGLSKGWAVIAYADFDPSQTVTVGGKTYDRAQLGALSQEVRYALANQWVAEVGGTKELADFRTERDKYVAAHPDIKGYDDYKDQITKSGLGQEAWIATTRLGNKNYDRYLTEQETKYGTSARDAAFTPGAYFAFKGAQQNIYDPAAISVRDMKDVPFNANETVGGVGTSSSGGGSADTSVSGRAVSLAEDIATYNAEMASVSQYLPKTVAWEELSPAVRSAYEASLKKQGIDIPTMPAKVREYYRWANTRKVGDDLSYEAFITWMDSLTEKAAA